MNAPAVRDRGAPACHHEAVAVREGADRNAPWTCPVCRSHLSLDADRRRWACPLGHSFDVAREGYVNLLLAGQRRRRQPGDSPEMVKARKRFLASGAYDPLTTVLAQVVADEQPALVLDVGCGEGRHTRGVTAPMVLGVDVAKPAIVEASRAHQGGWYAVASAEDLPLGTATVDLALDVFGPVAPIELARVIRPGGTVVAAHPGPTHLEGLRSLVYGAGRPHEVKPPFRDAPEWFTAAGTEVVTFPFTASDPAQLNDLFAMTPYWWQATPDVHARLAAAASRPFDTVVDVRVTTYQRTLRPASP
jgi:23S rRNA (guanine745-N1)-methyltransferase